MPTYEYRCPSGHEFERFFRTISKALPELPCPECGKVAERRMSAGAGLVFKGSGFYLTDYGKNAHAKRGESKPSAEGSGARSDAGGTSSGETKSATSESGATKGAESPSPEPPAKPEAPAPSPPQGARNRDIKSDR